ncbi:MAG: Crp/Fnr family transcriptional regulator, partial [Planctomycetota bacterium]
MAETNVFDNDALRKIAAHPGFHHCRVTFQEGETLFLEGDESQDLYILVSGELEILKGDKSLSEVSAVGSPFGEISFLLETKRTATVRAKTDGEAICIPRRDIDQLFREFPAVAWQIPRILARRLDRISQILYGLKEFSDQLPDAVMVTDREGKVLSWNAAAENLYGESLERMLDTPIEALYRDPEAGRDFFAEVQSRSVVKERVLEVTHP